MGAERVTDPLVEWWQLSPCLLLPFQFQNWKSKVAFQCFGVFLQPAGLRTSVARTNHPDNGGKNQIEKELPQ